MYVTNGLITFDYHGYVLGEKLLSRYWKGHQDCYCGWQANIEKLDFPLLDTTALNKRKHLGRLWFAVSINAAVDQAASFASASAF